MYENMRHHRQTSPAATLAAIGLVAGLAASKGYAQVDDFDVHHDYTLVIPANPSDISARIDWKNWAAAQSRKKCKAGCHTCSDSMEAGYPVPFAVGGISMPDPVELVSAPDSYAKCQSQISIASIVSAGGQTTVTGQVRGWGEAEATNTGCTKKRRKWYGYAYAEASAKINFGWNYSSALGLYLDWMGDYVTGGPLELSTDPVIATVIDRTSGVTTEYPLITIKTMEQGGVLKWGPDGGIGFLSNTAPTMMFDAVVGGNAAVPPSESGVLRITARDGVITEVNETGVFLGQSGLSVGDGSSFIFRLDAISLNPTLPIDPTHDVEVQLSLGGGGHASPFPDSAIASCSPLSELFGGALGADISAPYKDFATLGLPAELGVAHAADDFDIPEGQSLYPDTVVVHAYQDGAPAAGGPTITGAFARIWDGPPGAGTVVAGDLVTNRLDAATFNGAYRVDAADPDNTSRFIQDLELDLFGMPALPYGTYWLEIALVGAPAYGQPNVIPSPWPSASDNAAINSGGSNIWDSAVDYQSQQALGLCFSFFAGETPSECDADFNSDGAVDTRDFISFLTAWGSHDAATDWDLNGVIDSRDVIGFLNDWAAGC
ncbi:MAG: hypothetical protein IT431_17250 [Phycisphaerales bacterium]|nr:hypothetical protein [Phycisphaerales bacterium]